MYGQVCHFMENIDNKKMGKIMHETFQYESTKGCPRHFSRCKSETHIEQREKWRSPPLSFAFQMYFFVYWAKPGANQILLSVLFPNVLKQVF